MMSGGESARSNVRNWRALGLRFRAAFLGMNPLCFFCLLGDGTVEDVENNW